MPLTRLKKLDELKEVSYSNHKIFIHRDHRYILPIIFHAQNLKYLPKPSTLVFFDYHPDNIKVEDMTKITNILQNGLNLDTLIDFCMNDLKKNDDDWLLTGIELGLIDDVVIFGVNSHFSSFPDDIYIDNNNIKHKIIIKHSHPGNLLHYQGDLSDTARSTELESMWKILNWKFSPEMQCFNFYKNTKRIILDFDLDAFIVQWEEYLFPWPDEVFDDRYLKESEYYTTNGWTGKKFVRKLIEKAGIITIASEPTCCGNEVKSEIVFNKLNKYIFDDELKI
ncbi:MAG: hypothetical protein GF353_01575 [Candidatus Lokiarchaeota archaeon]|nr:hypothetical protein [Candidatus Lokiarchaeota archaeon]